MATGTFTSKDTYAGTLTDILSQNRYTYAENNPVTYADPSGHAKSRGGLSSLRNNIKIANGGNRKNVKQPVNNPTAAAKAMYQSRREALALPKENTLLDNMRISYNTHYNSNFASHIYSHVVANLSITALTSNLGGFTWAESLAAKVEARKCLAYDNCINEVQERIFGKNSKENGDIPLAVGAIMFFEDIVPYVIDGTIIPWGTLNGMVVEYEFKYDWTKEGLDSSEYVTPEFLNKVAEISNELEIDPDNLMAVMIYESWCNPALKNSAGSSGTGLIQFMSPTAKELGTTIEELAQMSAVDQLDYVYKHYEPFKGKMKDLGDVYMVTLYQEAVGEDNDYAVFIKGDKNYGSNDGLDYNHDGIVTREEAINAVIERRNLYEK